MVKEGISSVSVAYQDLIESGSESGIQIQEKKTYKKLRNFII
jgi:hypothetical protein